MPIPATWKKVSPSRNPDASKGRMQIVATGVVKDLDGGSCMGMCLHWIKKILKTNYSNTSFNWNTGDEIFGTMYQLQNMMLTAEKGVLERATRMFDNNGMKFVGQEARAIIKTNNNTIDPAERIKAVNILSLAPPAFGCFRVGVPGHQMAYSVSPNGKIFFFDPNEGVYEFPLSNTAAGEIIDYSIEDYLEDADDYMRFQQVTL